MERFNTTYDDMNVSTITDYGVGDYQVNFTRQLRNSSNNVTDYLAVSFAINGGVYNVSGQLAHTHALSTGNGHVDFFVIRLRTRIKGWINLIVV